MAHAASSRNEPVPWEEMRMQRWGAGAWLGLSPPARGCPWLYPPNASAARQLRAGVFGVTGEPQGSGAAAQGGAGGGELTGRGALAPAPCCSAGAQLPAARSGAGPAGNLGAALRLPVGVRHKCIGDPALGNSFKNRRRQKNLCRQPRYGMRGAGRAQGWGAPAAPGRFVRSAFIAR